MFKVTNSFFMKNKHKLLNGSTIIESLIALVITSLSFGIGMMILLNIISNEKTSIKQHASWTLEQLANETIIDNNTLEEAIVFHNDFRVLKKWILINEKEQVYQLKLEALNNKGNPICAYSKVIVLP